MRLLRFSFILAFLIFLPFPQATSLGRVSRLPKTNGFLLYRTNSINQRPCTCSTTISCSCCETVTLLYSKRQKKLCSNFVYQINGLKVDISLNTDILKTTTVSIYRPFKLCSNVPGSLFSSICVNILELNEFPRSITVCVRHVIVTKSQEWQINYTCSSVSTEIPKITSNGTMSSGMLTATSIGTTMASIDTKPSVQVTMATSLAMTASSSTMKASSSAMTAVPSTMKASSSSMTASPSTMKASSSAMTASPSTMKASSSSMTASSLAMTTTKIPATTVKVQSSPSSMMAIIGARRRRRRRRRRANRPEFYKSRIVNENDDLRAVIFNDKLPPGSSYRPSFDSMTIYSAIPLSKISNFSTNANSGITMTNERISFNGDKETNIFHNVTEYFPSRIPPLIAKKISLNQNDNVHAILGTNKTDILIFPN